MFIREVKIGITFKASERAAQFRIFIVFFTVNNKVGRQL